MQNIEDEQATPKAEAEAMTKDVEEVNPNVAVPKDVEEENPKLAEQPMEDKQMAPAVAKVSVSCFIFFWCSVYFSFWF